MLSWHWVNAEHNFDQGIELMENEEYSGQIISSVLDQKNN